MVTENGGEFYDLNYEGAQTKRVMFSDAHYKLKIKASFF